MCRCRPKCLHWEVPRDDSAVFSSRIRQSFVSQTQASVTPLSHKHRKVSRNNDPRRPPPCRERYFTSFRNPIDFLHIMKLHFLSRKRQTSTSTLDSRPDVNDIMLADMLQEYSSRRPDAMLSAQNQDHMYCLTVNSLPFLFSMTDSNIHVRTFFSQVRCLTKDTIDEMEQSHIYVDWNDANQAGLSQELNLNFLQEEEAFYSHIDSIVRTIQRLAKRKCERRIYRLSAPKESVSAV